MVFDISTLGLRKKIVTQTQAISGVTTTDKRPTPVSVTKQEITSVSPQLTYGEAMELMENVDGVEWRKFGDRDHCVKVMGRRLIITNEIHKKIMDDQVKPLADSKPPKPERKKVSRKRSTRKRS